MDHISFFVFGRDVDPNDKTELHIFDFDGTMFRSPGPHPGLPSAQQDAFWHTQESLGGDLVPEHPNENWYVKRVVDAFKEARKKPQNLVVVMTGRSEPMRKRVHGILHSADLRPDELILKPQEGVSTRDYKNQATQALLKKYPKIRRVHFWEDRKNHLTDFQQTTEALGYKFVPRHVDEAPSKGVWKDFLRVFYESGAMMVPNTNTESRDIHPKVRVDYLLKTDPNFRRSLEKRLRTWTSMGRPGIKKTSATTRAILRLARTHQELRQRLIEAFLRERAKGAV